MATETDIDLFKGARDRLVAFRRTMARQVLDGGLVETEDLNRIVALQAAIEATDRTIAEVAADKVDPGEAKR